MPDIISSFNDPDILGLILVLAINIIFIAELFYFGKGKIKFPLNIFIFNTLFGLGVFASTSGIGISYAYVVVLVASGLLANIYKHQFFGIHQASRQQILIIYSVFFITFMFLQASALENAVFSNESALSGSVPNLKPVDNCGGFGIFLCAYNTANNMLSLFGFSSSIEIINTLLIAPYLIFVGIYVIEIIRGVG